MGFIGIRFELGTCVLSEFDEDGFLVVQPDGLGSQPRIDPYEAHHPLGFAARPQDPDTDSKGNVLQGQSCTALLGALGNEKHIWPLEDPRGVEQFPPLKKGGSAQYAVRALNDDGVRLKSFDVHDGDDGTKTIYVEFEEDGEVKAHLITAGIDASGKAVVEIVHGNGQALTLLNQSVTIRNAAGDSYIEVGTTGVSMNGDLALMGGVSCYQDLKTGLGVSVNTHTHLTAMGPSGPPIPIPG